MDMSYPNPSKPPSIRARQQGARRVSLPLGTAEWYEFPKGVTPGHQKGDFFAGYTFDGKPVGLNDDGHIFVAAGTRAGKGVSIVVPNLTYWPGSVFVIDPKGENAVLTARRRGNGSKYARGLKQKTIILDPFKDVHTDEDDFFDLKGSFNPLDLMKENPERAIDYAAKIADSVIDRTGSTDPFWPDSAHALIKGIILHIASSTDFKDHERNLVTVRRLVSEGYWDLQQRLRELDPDGAPGAYDLLFRAMEKNVAYDREVSLAGARFARSISENPRLMESIAAIANTNLDFLGSPEMKKCVSASSFKLSELKEHPNGLSLYLCLPQYMMETHFRFLRMIVSLMMAEMMRIKYKPKSGYPILCVLDEFAGLKRMPVIEQSCAQIAGSGVKMMFIVQDLGQLQTIYSKNYQTFLGNSNTRIFFGNTAPFDKEMISKMAGQLEVTRETRSRSQSEGASQNYGRNNSEGSSLSYTHGSSSTMSSGGADGFAFSSTYSNSVTHSTNQSEGQNSSFGINTGYRAGEILSLTVGKVAHLNAGDLLEIKQSKNQKYRPVSLNPMVIASLKNWLDAHPNPTQDAPLFISQKGKNALTVSAVNRMIKSWCKEIGLQGNFGSHSMRKTWGYHQRTLKNRPIALLMEAFGHATQAQTLAYLGIQQTEILNLFDMEL